MKNTKLILKNTMLFFIKIVKHFRRYLIRKKWVKTIIKSIIPIKKQILFIAYEGKQYSCNPKYITEYLLEHFPNIFNIVWAFNEPEKFEYLKEKGIKIIPTRSWKFLKTMCSSKIIISNSGVMVDWLSKKQFYIETYHGSGAYKKSEADEPNSSLEHKKNIVKIFNRPNLILSGNTKLTELVFRGSACQSHSEILEQGTPRNDMFFTDYSHIIKKIHKYYNISTDKKIVLYAPTFREDKKSSDYDINYQKLQQTLSNKLGGEWVILFRKHYHANSDTGELCKSSEVPLGINKTNIINASNYPDMQELLYASDVHITDYSSSMWDFSLTDRPCFIYATDIDEYKQERDFYTPMEQCPFPIAKNNEELVKNIENFNKEEYNKKVKQHHIDLGLCETGEASKAVCERIYQEYFK